MEYSTITELFTGITSRYHAENRPMLMHKVDGTYVGISYNDVQKSIDDFAYGLASLGVKRSDLVAIISENRPEWITADQAILTLGAVSVPLYPTLTPKQIAFILNDANVKLALVSNQLQLSKVMKILEEVPALEKIILISEKNAAESEKVLFFSSVLATGRRDAPGHPGFLAQERAKCRPDDLLTIIYTSGTTGNPKGVMLTHKNLVSNIRNSAKCIPIRDTDTLLSFLPLCHSFERMAGYYTAVSCGATIAYAESIDTVRENMLEVKPTIITTVPRLFERIHNRILKQIEGESALHKNIFSWAISVGHAYADAKKSGAVSPLLAVKNRIADALVFKKIRARTGGRLRFFISGGAALSSELGKFFEAIGILIIEGYGMTESSPVITVNRVDDYKFGCVGKPIPGVEVKIAPDGEILARGDNVMKGYWNSPEATAEMIDADGWLHTGDIGMIDGDGFLKITDRKKHLFVNSGGKNIAPQPIEGHLLQSPYVDQIVLIGDRRMYCTALIVPDFDALKSYAKQQKISNGSNDALVKHEEIIKLMQTEIDRNQQDLANYERVRKFTLLDHPLTIEAGEITPTQKVKRKVVEEKYKELIEKMYEGRG